jgi:O-methyltransferase involved in polyketide biosynthesis
MAPTSTAISPTAHYTGYVWARNGLSHLALQTLEGRIMFEALQPAMLVNRALGRGTLEGYLLARHRAIDLLLERAIDEHGVTQVIELASGLSPRGWRFTQRYADRITYVETDLPDMAARKRRALERMGALSEHHRVAELDVLAADGNMSLGTVAAQLDSSGGLAVLAEGLIGYLPKEGTEAMWRRIADVLGGFATGRHIAHIHVRDVDRVQVEALSLLLSVFVRGRVRADYRNNAEIVAALTSAAFQTATVHGAPELLGQEERADTRHAHILEAVP